MFADANCPSKRNPHKYAQCYTHGYGHAYSYDYAYGYCNCNSRCNSYSYRYGHCHCQANADCQTPRNAQAASYSRAAAMRRSLPAEGADLSRCATMRLMLRSTPAATTHQLRETRSSLGFTRYIQ